MTPLAWNIRDLHCYSVCLAAPENTHLVRNLVRLVFGFLAPEKAKAAQMAAGECFIWRGRRGSNPRPPA
jgi:hypothetical protein